MDTETEEKSLKYWLVLAAVVLVLVIFGALDSEPAQWLMAGTFFGIIVAGIAMNRVRDAKTDRVPDDPEPRRTTVATRPVCEQKWQPKPPPESVNSALPRSASIREVNDRAVHGRAPFTVGDPELTMTPEQRRAIEEHVRRRNEAAARSVPPTPAQPQAPQRPSVSAAPAGTPAPESTVFGANAAQNRGKQETPAGAGRLRTAPAELQLEVVRLQEIAPKQSTKIRVLVERRLQDLDASDLPWPKVAREVEELFRAIRLERIAEFQRSAPPSNGSRAQ